MTLGGTLQVLVPEDAETGMELVVIEGQVLPNLTRFQVVQGEFGAVEFISDRTCTSMENSVAESSPGRYSILLELDTGTCDSAGLLQALLSLAVLFC